MPTCILRILICGDSSANVDLELRQLVELPVIPEAGADLRAFVSNHYDVPPLTIRRVMESTGGERAIVDLTRPIGVSS